MKQALRARLKRLSVEGLPPEVRRHLLSTLDFPGLKALVRASPTYHEQYHFDRKFFLCRILEKLLGSVAVNAYAVYVSRARGRPQQGNTRQVVNHVLHPYSEPFSQRYFLPIGEMTGDDAASMLAFYRQSVEPIANHFAAWRLHQFEIMCQGARDEPIRYDPNNADVDSVTNTEWTRLARATYRYQLLCQLTGPGTKSDKPKVDAVLALLRVLEPWEVEELECFLEFVRKTYAKVFDDIRKDLHPDNPDFIVYPHSLLPHGVTLDLNYVIQYDEQCYEGTSLRGLSLLGKVLFDIQDHQVLVSTMWENITKSWIPLNDDEGVFGPEMQHRRRQYDPSERDRMEADRVSLPFRGDGEPDGPPLGWTLIWGGTYINLYGHYIPEIREWGFVFWDAWRLDAMDGEELLRQQWEECWGEHTFPGSRPT
ncbi:hypothetical protein J7T55_010479 [Diaporthe amygdali]|uniref:uncharacterized protein n=1 Tax=Phomopsis amygdali TaxID=1214568 RepID=UPI0022FEE4D1|nr:uncharacterized protein J7T55_010479 [Diaporthe amygdali]KAJ0115656.1 hypothetical protein J7T55_010479 [Diaporthe amygdali]